MPKVKTKTGYSLQLTLANEMASHPIILGMAAIIKDCN
jgi:hypothetical protein